MNLQMEEKYDRDEETSANQKQAETPVIRMQRILLERVPLSRKEDAEEERKARE